MLSLLHSKLSEAQIVKKFDVSFSTISRFKAKHCSDFSGQKGGHSLKLFSADITYIKKLFQTGKAENAVQAAKVLFNVITTSFSPQTLRRGLKESKWRAVVKKK